MIYEYYNEHRNRVTDYVRSRKTLFTRSLRNAIILAKKQSTYYYEMFTIEKNELKFIGYGVPRN